LGFYVSSGQRMRLDGAGNVFANGNFYPSDIRKKTDIEQITGVLDDIDDLRGVFFNWKDENDGKDGQIGLIAQEVEAVYPELVLEDEEGYKNVEYSKMTAILLEAVKELKVENESLKVRLNVLEQSVK